VPADALAGTGLRELTVLPVGAGTWLPESVCPAGSSYGRSESWHTVDRKAVAADGGDFKSAEWAIQAAVAGDRGQHAGRPKDESGPVSDMKW